jgi:hypothetical protein
MLTLYDDVFSPYARKVRIALYEKGVFFERVRALHGDCNRTDFLHVNPRAEVPALVDGELSLYDAATITTSRMLSPSPREDHEFQVSRPAAHGREVARKGRGDRADAQGNRRLENDRHRVRIT